MKFKLLKLIENRLDEEFGGKNKELFSEHEGDLFACVKCQTYDIRKAEANEKVNVTIRGKQRGPHVAKEGDYFVRVHDNLEQVDLIDSKEFQERFEPLQQNAEPDAEGFITYRESGEWEAFKYNGEEKYIFTDWNTKQKLKAGDYLVRKSENKNDSGFVVPAAEFSKHFEEVK